MAQGSGIAEYNDLFMPYTEYQSIILPPRA